MEEWILHPTITYSSAPSASLKATINQANASEPTTGFEVHWESASKLASRWIATLVSVPSSLCNDTVRTFIQRELTFSQNNNNTLAYKHAT